MRPFVLLSTAMAAVVGLASCGDGDGVSVEACNGVASTPSGMATGAPSKPILGMLMLPNTSVVLARLDPLSLRPVSRQAEVGEYHDTWSLSPDRSYLAVGTGGQGIGVEVVALEEMKVVGRVQTGIAAEELGWLAPRLLVAGLQRGGTVLVDPLTGKILRRWRHLSDPHASARTRDDLVMLFPGPLPATPEGAAAPRLAVVDARGRLRSVALERIRLRVRHADGLVESWDEAGLAVDPDRARAYVLAADAPVAEVDPGTMQVSYRRLEPLFVSAGEVSGAHVETSGERWRRRRALWLGNGRLLVFGRDDFQEAGGERFESVATGAMLVDTATWRSCVLDRSAGAAAVVARRVLAHGRGDPTSRGIRGYTLEGRKAFHLLEREEVRRVQGAGDLAYVHTARAVHVVNASSGEVVSEIAPRSELVDVVVGRHGSGAAD